MIVLQLVFSAQCVRVRVRISLGFIYIKRCICIISVL